MRSLKVRLLLVLAASLPLVHGCANLKAESPGPFPYNSRYG